MRPSGKKGQDGASREKGGSKGADDKVRSKSIKKEKKKGCGPTQLKVTEKKNRASSLTG